MTVRPLPVLAVSLLFGTLAGAGVAYFPLSIFCAMALLLGGVLFLGLVGRCSPRWGCVVYGVFLLGAAGAALAQARAESPSLIRSVGAAKTHFVAVVEEPVRFGPDRAAAVLAIQRVVTEAGTVPAEGRIKLTVRGAVPPLIVGDLIEFETKLRPPRGLLNPAGYDYGAHLRRSGIQAVGNLTLGDDGSGLRILARGRIPVLPRVDRWRGEIREAALRSLPAPFAGIYLALVTGETGYLTAEVRDAFMASGTMHILSISGSHLGLIGVVVFAVTRRTVLTLPSRWLLRLSRHTTATCVAACATIPPVAFYAVLGGAEVATVRSLVMILIVLAAVLLGRSHGIGTSLALACVIIVGWNPLALFDISFQLSFLAVLTIVVVGSRRFLEERAPGLAAREESALERLRQNAVGVLSVSVFITLTSAPLVAAYFNQVAWVGGFSNLIVVPVVGILIVPAGLLACLATLLSGSEDLIGGPVVQVLLEALVWIVQGFAAFPGADLRVASPPFWQAAAFYACLAAAMAWRRQKKGLIAGALAMGLLCVWVWSPRHLPPAESVRVTFLDVGQGDAALVETADGHVMLIDGGSMSGSSDMGRMAIAPLLWDRGIRRLDVVVATHPQMDHIGGLAYILKQFDVAVLWTNGVRRERDFVRRLEEVIASRGVPVRAVSAIDAETSLGPCRIRVLNPLEPPAHAPERDGKQLNNLSVVIRLQCGEGSFLFTGDAERQAEIGISRANRELNASVLKVPHHGALGSVDERFLQAVNPRFAVISVSGANPYGHPSPAMLETYGRLGIPVFRTDRDGAVTVTSSSAGIVPFCESGRRLRRVQRGRESNGMTESKNYKRLLEPSFDCGPPVRHFPG